MHQYLQHYHTSNTASLTNITTVKMDNMDIYVNADAIRGNLGNENAVSNTTRTFTSPSPQLTVKDSVKMRCYRSVTVCLALLCVLLLPAVIVLCVKFTGDREQLILKIDNLTNELHICLDGWTHYKSSLYHISNVIMTWNDSRRYCRERGADLIIINNKEEQGFVSHMAGTQLIWMGLSYSDEEGIWKWVDGSTLISGFWRAGEPHKNATCAANYLFEWDYFVCYAAITCICEKNFK